MFKVAKVAEINLEENPKGSFQFDIGTRRVGNKLEVLLRLETDEQNKQKTEA